MSRRKGNPQVTRLNALIVEALGKYRKRRKLRDPGTADCETEKAARDAAAEALIEATALRVDAEAAEQAALVNYAVAQMLYEQCLSGG